MSTGPRSAILVATGLFVVWAGATWLLEGRIDTFLRPEAAADRLIYIVVANLIIGIAGAAFAIRFSVESNGADRGDTGFGRGRPSATWIAIGLALGLGLYLVQGAPSYDPVVIINACAQVLAVSVAEVVVCWALVGRVLKRMFGAYGSRKVPHIGRSKWIGTIGATVVSSILFGIYHFGHSAPFNTVSMVAFLAFIGLWTSAFFFLSRDVYATVAFHNFLGVFGVARALAAAGKLEGFSTLQVPLLVTAVVALLALIGSDALVVRRNQPTEVGHAAH
ncbi:MAG: hypothetical protein E5X80_19680 [Mesorhizobium sp.]|uniref:hypothetical protein n=1 Tax=Mesorhizobium sp. TaxID=1871066 RepID=UPI000FE93BA3|nr:hypothetical protein [Mesorhizobium sp.]RWM04398.1 MAG: hypothetical protein EOR71_26505 [Mesorhizobium sp.]TIO50159.1 MAG: hypothetical protein E5X78_22970 [Mesorhizobium sp.]TIO57297.1 MAG: hypothetical protein E5X79_26890 [Mesorhizobium sp.]TJV61793.1 MAG: hypothetical protein E5X80_19680 [Mesorhizobium sp.]